MKFYEHTFRWPRMLIDRANFHIDSLEASISTYLKKSPIRVETYEVSDLNYLAWRVVVQECPPQDWSAQIGDAIHNLRISLDCLVSALAEVYGERKLDKVAFPFAKSKDNLGKRIKECELNFLPKNIIEYIYKLEPYKDGNALLYGIHCLDIWSKHRAIVPDCGLIKALSGSVVIYESSQLRLGEIMKGISRKDNLLIEGIRPGQKFDASLSIRFPQEAPFGEKLIVDTLREASIFYQEILGEFSRLSQK